MRLVFGCDDEDPSGQKFAERLQWLCEKGAEAESGCVTVFSQIFTKLSVDVLFLDLAVNLESFRRSHIAGDEPWVDGNPNDNNLLLLFTHGHYDPIGRVPVGHRWNVTAGTVVTVARRGFEGGNPYWDETPIFASYKVLLSLEEPRGEPIIAGVPAAPFPTFGNNHVTAAEVRQACLASEDEDIPLNVLHAVCSLGPQLSWESAAMDLPFFTSTHAPAHRTNDFIVPPPVSLDPDRPCPVDPCKYLEAFTYGRVKDFTRLRLVLALLVGPGIVSVVFSGIWIIVNSPSREAILPCAKTFIDKLHLAWQDVVRRNLCKIQGYPPPSMRPSTSKSLQQMAKDALRGEIRIRVSYSTWESVFGRANVREASLAIYYAAMHKMRDVVGDNPELIRADFVRVIPALLSCSNSISNKYSQDDLGPDNVRRKLLADLAGGRHIPLSPSVFAKPRH